VLNIYTLNTQKCIWKYNGIEIIIQCLFVYLKIIINECLFVFCVFTQTKIINTARYTKKVFRYNIEMWLRCVSYKILPIWSQLLTVISTQFVCWTINCCNLFYVHWYIKQDSYTLYNIILSRIKTKFETFGRGGKFRFRHC